MPTKLFVSVSPWLASILGLFLLLVPRTLIAQEYSLPLGEQAPLTSTFGEYRTRHFHGGLDLSTGGETGLEVYAASSGIVWRLRVSGAGYGKAIYLRLDDGRIAVYAHLKDFSARIQQVAEGIQNRAGTYRIDHIFEEDGPRVDAGEVIAYSGDTGAGPAHLHFELREGETQLNPLTHGVQVRDTLAPRIGSLILIPLSPGSFVDGVGDRLAVGLRWDRSLAVYTTDRVPLVQGDVGIACRVYDLADGKSNRLAPYRMRLSVDGAIAYEVQFDRVSLLSSHHVEITYDSWHAMRGSMNVLNLFSTPGTRAGVARDQSPWAGVLDVVSGGAGLGKIPLPAGPHEIEAHAWDVNGNHRSATMRVVADSRPLITDAELSPGGGQVKLAVFDPEQDQLTLTIETSTDGGSTWSGAFNAEAFSPYSGHLDVPRLDGEGIIRVTAKDQWGAVSPAVYLGSGLRAKNDTPPKMAVRLLGNHVEAVCGLSSPSAFAPGLLLIDEDASIPIRELKTSRVGLDSFHALIPLEEFVGRRAAILASVPGPNGLLYSRHELALTGVRRDTTADVEFPVGAVLAFAEGSFLRDAVLRAVARESTEFTWQDELTPLSKVFEFMPEDQFFDKPVSLFLPLDGGPSNLDRVGLYRRAGRGLWRWVGGDRRGENTMVGGRITHFSLFALMEDVVPPRVVRLRPRQGQRASGRGLFLEARVKDSGSGLDWDNVYFRIDGEKLITAWEAERNHAWVRVPHNLPPGPHEVEFFAADRAGNETAQTVSIVVTR